MIGLSTLTLYYGLTNYGNIVLALFFLALFIGSLVVMVVPFPIFNGTGKLCKIMRNISLGRKDILQNSRKAAHSIRTKVRTALRKKIYAA